MKILKTAFCMAGLIAISASAVAAGPTRNELVFDMPAQSLSAALNSFGRQTGLSVAFYDYAVADRTAGALSGKFTPEEALQKLLENSGLQYTYVNENTVAIRAVEGSDKGKRLSGAAEFYLPFAQLAQADSSLAGAEAIKRNEESPSNVAGQPGLEEIIVTARKVSERLQDVPVSVSAVTGEELRRIGATDIKDALGRIPGLSFADNSRGNSKYAIRGVSNDFTFLPTTGVYLDDISLLTRPSFNSGAFDPIFFDIERVEVLKGPQGTLYGGSAMGGAIKYVTARPDLNRELLSAASGISTTAHGGVGYNTEVVYNLPVVQDVLAVRFGASMIHEAGYVDNVAGLDAEDTSKSETDFPTYTPLTQPSLATQSRKDYNYSDIYSLRASVLYQPDPSWSIRTTALYQRSREEAPPFFWLNLEDFTSSYRYLSQPHTDRGTILSLDIRKSFGAFDLTSLTGYFDRNQVWGRDYSFYVGFAVPSLYSFNSFIYQPFQTRTISQEFRIASAADSDSPLRWLIGGFLSRQNLSSKGYDLPVVGVVSLLKYVEDEHDIDEDAVFGEASYALTERLELTAGARVWRIDREDNSVQSGALVNPNPNTPVASPDLNNEDKGVNPKLGLSYKLSQDNLLYASAAKGYRAGADTGSTSVISICEDDIVRAGFPNGKPRFYDPDNLWSYEVGTKNQFADKKVTLNGSLYYIDWKDIQQSIALPDCGQGFATNAGDARIYGTEWEARFNPARALEIGGNVTYLDAKIDNPRPNINILPGAEILNIPEWTASAFGSYSVPISDQWSLRFQADYQYRGRQRRQFAESQTVFYPGGEIASASLPVYQESYELANAAIFLSGSTVNFRFYVNNLFDVAPLLEEAYSVGTSRAMTLRPRTIGSEVRLNF